MPKPPAKLRYRVICYELDGKQQTVILDTTARAFIAVTGTIEPDGTIRGAGTHAGPKPLLKQIAQLIATDPYLAD